MTKNNVNKNNDNEDNNNKANNNKANNNEDNVIKNNEDNGNKNNRDNDKKDNNNDYEHGICDFRAVLHSCKFQLNFIFMTIVRLWRLLHFQLENCPILQYHAACIEIQFG